MALENLLYARAFNSEHQVQLSHIASRLVFKWHQMELINECSLRFAEDKVASLIVVHFVR
jgi:meiotic recombination protein DMC1